ncbi:MAG: hypothetical protein JST31_12080 [Actinobacteria bacterium]|nr:hypothetical protein [Actinomycetota bacterium]
MDRERGQGTVEMVGLLGVVTLALLGMLAAGAAVPGGALAREIAGRIVCAAALADGCGDEPLLIATYGDEIGRLLRRHAPTLAFEQGSRALPVDWRRCRLTECGDGPEAGNVHRSDQRLPVTAFVHVVDCRAEAREESEAARFDCSGPRAGFLYLQYWLYYANSTTGQIPVVGPLDQHDDDWESVQLRIGPDGRVQQRASSHHGYNYERSAFNAGSDAGLEVVREVSEDVGLREERGWGAETGLVEVSGGSHAGNVGHDPGSRFIPGRRLHLVPLEPIAAHSHSTFAVVPPWLKEVWRNPEATGTE